MKFLIAVPRFVARTGQYYEFPLGLAYISSALKRAGHEVLTLNLNHSETLPADAVAAAVREFDPDVCATGTLSPHYRQAKAIFSAAREAKPSIVPTLLSTQPTTSGPSSSPRSRIRRPPSTTSAGRCSCGPSIPAITWLSRRP